MSAVGGGTCNWTYSGVNPDHWAMEESNDGGVTWLSIGNVAGSVRTFTGWDPGYLGRLRGEDSSNNQVNATSNVVSIT